MLYLGECDVNEAALSPLATNGHEAELDLLEIRHHAEYLIVLRLLGFDLFLNGFLCFFVELDESLLPFVRVVKVQLTIVRLCCH